MRPSDHSWYRRLQVQLWLWAVLPLVLVVAALTFGGVYSHQRAMYGFVSERDVAMATLYARQIDDALAHGTVTLDGTGLSLIVRDRTVGRRGVVYVVDPLGRVLFHPDLQNVGQVWTERPAVRRALASMSGTADGQFRDGTATLASFATVGETRWRVLVEEPVSDVIVPILRFSSALPVVIAAAGLLSVLLTYFSLRTIVHPLRHLSEAAAQITWGELSEVPAEVGGVEEIRYLGRVLRDMVERIRGYQRSMRDYVAAIVQGQESERARLSRELHDATVQNWIATRQRLLLAQRALERGDAAAARQILGQTQQLADVALDELRRTIRALRPAYLEDLGLFPALEMLVHETQEAGLPTELTVQGEPRRLPPELELVAYRVVQEALANAAQHARAQQAVVNVSVVSDRLSLSVSDDGTGFVPPTGPEDMTSTGHFGLLGMRERVLLVGGSLELQSQPGAGTRLLASFPLPRE